MKKIIQGFVLSLVMFMFGMNLGLMGEAQASPLFAQTPPPAANPENQKEVPPPLNAPVAKPTTPPVPATPIVPKPKPPKEQSSGPYDMEAMKAFSRALYGS